MSVLTFLPASSFGSLPSTHSDNQLMRFDGANTKKIQVCPGASCSDAGLVTCTNLSAGNVTATSQVRVGSSATYFTQHAGASMVDAIMNLAIYGKETSFPLTQETLLSLYPQINQPILYMTGFLGQSHTLMTLEKGGFGASHHFIDVNTNGGSGGDLLTVDQNARLGIKQASPSAMIDIVQSGAAVPGLEINGTTNRSAVLLQLVEGGGTPTGDFLQVSTKFYIDVDGQVGIDEPDPETLIEITHASPYQTFHCETETDADGGRASKLLFKGEDSLGVESTLASITAAHDGSSLDQKGRIILNVNHGYDLIEVFRACGGTSYFRINDNIDPAGTYNLGQGNYSNAIFSKSLHGTYQQVCLYQSDAASPAHTMYGFSSSADGGNTWFPRFIVKNGGNIGVGTKLPDKIFEINSATGGEIRLSYNAPAGSATDYCDLSVGANGDFTITTVDSDGAAGHINLNPDGNVGIKESSPGASFQISNAAVSDIGQIIKLAASPTANAFEVNTNGGSGGDLVKITEGGKVQSVSGFRAVAKQWGDAYIGWKYGGDTAEHSGQTGSYDYTGGTYDRLFTATAAVFSQDDEDNHTWIVIKSGTYKGAKAEIETYIDTTHVIVRSMGWTGDIASSTFDIVPHPLIVAGDGCNVAFCIGNEGNFHIRSKGFTGLDEEDSVITLVNDFGADNLHGLSLDITANGYNHIDGASVNLNTGDLQPGDITHAIHIDIDETEATSADSTTDIDGITLETTDVSSASKHAIHVLVGFDTALFVSGAAAEDPDYGYEVASGSVIDRVNSGGAGDDAFINAAVDQQIFDADNDYILIGSDATFEVIQCVLTTPANQDCILEFYYSKAGDGWTQFYPSDGTAGFTRSGNISFTAPGDWTQDDEAEANGDITNAYYIKILRTRNNLVTAPTEDYFKIYVSLDDGMQIRGDGTIKPASLADANAANESIYYSTDQSKLVFKDSGGSVNDLY